MKTFEQSDSESKIECYKVIKCSPVHKARHILLSQLHSRQSQMAGIYTGTVLPSDDASSAISISSASTACVVATPSCYNKGHSLNLQKSLSE